MINPDTASGALGLDSSDDDRTGSRGMGTRVVSAFFDSRDSADDAVSRLKSAGIPDSNISVAYGAGSGASSSSSGSESSSSSYYGSDQSLSGLGSGSSESGTSRSGTSGSGEQRGFLEMLGDFFFPDEDRDAYAEGLNRGGHLVTVMGLDDTQYDTALDILDDEGAVDMDERTESWRAEGWTSGRSGSGSSTYGSGMGGGAAAGIGGIAGGGIGGSLSDPSQTGISSVETGDSTTVAGTSGLGYDDRSVDEAGFDTAMEDDPLDEESLSGSSGTVGIGSAGYGTSATGTGAGTGYGATSGSGAGYGSASTGIGGTARGDDETIKVVEERLRVGKRDTSRGSVRVRSYIVEEPVSETVNLREERVEIERRPVNRGTTDLEGAFTNKVIEAEEYREEAVASKEARVVEEIGLRKTSDEHQETVSDTVRRTEVEIEDDRDDTLNNR